MRYLTALLAFLLSTATCYTNLPLECFEGKGLFTTYYSSIDFNEPFVAQELTTPYKVLSGAKPHPNTTNHMWSINYSGIFLPKNSGSYIFSLTSDDGGRINLEGSRIAGVFSFHSFTTSSSQELLLVKNEPYIFSVDFFENLLSSGLYVTATFNNVTSNITLEEYEPCALLPAPIENLDCSTFEDGLIGTYYDSSSFDFPVFTRVDSYDPFMFNYFDGSPDASLSADSFSIRYKGSISVPVSGIYRIHILTSEYIQVRLSNIVIIENGIDTEPRAKISPIIKLIGGEYYPLEIEYFEKSGNASFELKLSKLGFDGKTETVPVSYLSTCVNYAIVSPQRATIHGLLSVPIPVRLRTQPTSDVVVSIVTSKDAYASLCTLTFTSSNWDIPQFVRVRTTSPNQNLTFTASSDDNNYNSIATDSVTYIIGDALDCENPPNSTEPGTCTAWGDPHLITFDGVIYDFHEIGDHYLVRSWDSEFVVQSRQGICGPGTYTCNFAIAIKYQNARIRITISSVTGVPELFYNNETTLIGIEIVRVVDNFQITFPNGIFVLVVSAYWPQRDIYFLNAFITLPGSYRGKAFGLCGLFDGNKFNEFHDRNGIPVSLSAFTNFWMVSPSENLFEEIENSIPPLSNSSLPTIDPCLFTQCPREPDCTLTLAFVQGYCAGIFLFSEYGEACTESGVDLTPFYNECITQVLDLCDPNAVRNISCAYQLACQNVTTVPQCTCLCHFQGKCVSDGECQCDDGTVGDDCPGGEVSLPCSNVTNPAFFIEGDSVYISVSNLRNDSQRSCSFETSLGNIIVPGETVDPNTIKCVIPDLTSEIGDVIVTVLENGNATTCAVEIPHEIECPVGTRCYDLGLDTICYSDETKITTFCYTFSIADCSDCTNGTVFIETDCGFEIISFNINGNVTIRNGTLGWEFNTPFSPGDSGEVCFDVHGIVKVVETKGIFVTSLGEIIVSTIKAPQCHPLPTTCPTSPPPTEPPTCPPTNPPTCPPPTQPPTEPPCPTEPPTEPPCPTPTQSSDSCYTVRFSRSKYNSYHDKTEFCYIVTIDGANTCKDLCDWMLSFDCGCESYPNGYQNHDPTKGMNGWKWDDGQDRGTTKEYCLYVEGHIDKMEMGEWAIKAGSHVYRNTIPVPKCPKSDHYPTHQNSDPPIPTLSTDNCFTVQYEGRSYDWRYGDTEFCYLVTVSSAQYCRDLDSLVLGFTCGYESKPGDADLQYNDPTTMISGWKFDQDQSKGSIKRYCIYVAGKISELVPSQWAIKSGSQVYRNIIPVPKCTR